MCRLLRQDFIATTIGITGAGIGTGIVSMQIKKKKKRQKRVHPEKLTKEEKIEMEFFDWLLKMPKSARALKVIMLLSEVDLHEQALKILRESCSKMTYDEKLAQIEALQKSTGKIPNIWKN